MTGDESAFDTMPGRQKVLNHQDGLTKRELFAAMAMQGLLAGVYSSAEMLNDFTTNERGKYPAHVTGAVAVSENAVRYADALIAELAKERA